MASLNPLAWLQRKESGVGRLMSLWNIGRPVWTPREYDRLAEEAFIRNAIAFRCTKMIAEGAASIPWLLFDAAGKEIESHPLLDLLTRPNPVSGGAALFEAIYAYRILAGNSYVEAVGPKNGAPKELWTLRPDRMMVIPGENGLPRAFAYSVNGQEKTWDGMSRIEAAIYSIDRHNAGSAHNKALLDNGARPSGALVFKPVTGGTNQPAQTAPEEVIEEARKRLGESHGGPANAGRPFVFGGNVDWVEMGKSLRDMDFKEGMDAAARDLCTAIGVPHILIVPGSATYNNVHEAKLDLWEQTILPLVDNTLDELNNWLVPMFGDGLVLKVDKDEIDALEPRRESKRSTVRDLRKDGIITRDEARAALQYEPWPKEAVGTVDAQVLKALMDGMQTIGPDPLVRYMKSVGLVDPKATVEQIIGIADGLLASTRDQATNDALAALPPQNGDTANAQA